MGCKANYTKKLEQYMITNSTKLTYELNTELEWCHRNSDVKNFD